MGGIIVILCWIAMGGIIVLVWSLKKHQLSFTSTSLEITATDTLLFKGNIRVFSEPLYIGCNSEMVYQVSIFTSGILITPSSVIPLLIPFEYLMLPTWKISSRDILKIERQSYKLPARNKAFYGYKISYLDQGSIKCLGIFTIDLIYSKLALSEGRICIE